MFSPRTRILTGGMSVFLYAWVAAMMWEPLPWFAWASAALALLRAVLLGRQVMRLRAPDE